MDWSLFERTVTVAVILLNEAAGHLVDEHCQFFLRGQFDTRHEDT